MNNVKCEIKKLVIPTYPEPAAEEMPMFAENRTSAQAADPIRIRLCFGLTERIKSAKNTP